MADTFTDQYVFELEHSLEKLLEFFEPGACDTYIIEGNSGQLFEISDDMAGAVDRAMDVLYGESSE